jgi:hypothetical protein
MGGIAVARTLPKELMRGETGAAAGWTATLAGGGRRRRAGRGRALARRPRRTGDAAGGRCLGEVSLNDAAAIGADEGDSKWIQSWVEEGHGVSSFK